mgnify:CR=1 FL=1
MRRPDNKIGIFSPEAKQALVISQDGFKAVFMKLSTDHPEVMPNEITGIGLAFGSMALTTWKRFVALARKAGGEILE